jgi:hypothetical protein
MTDCPPLRRLTARRRPSALAVRALFLALAAIASPVAASGLPQVAPPGPGAAKGPAGTGSAVQDSYQRRLDASPRPAAPATVTPAPGDSVLFPTPSGAVTDRGTSLTGQGGVLRDDQGGVWNCNTSGCFSPSGEFRPMYKTSPAAPADR